MSVPKRSKRSGPASPARPLPARSSTLRDVLIVVLSGVVLIVAAGASRKSERAPAEPSVGGSAVMLSPPPLPSGASTSAPTWAYDESEAGCHFVDHGFGDYERWRPLPVGRALIPRTLGVDPESGFDLLVHFHGADAVRKQLATEPPNLVVAGVDVGAGSSKYAKAFADAGAWRSLVASIEREVATAFDLPRAHVRRLALSSWSAGYGAVAQVLAQTRSSTSAPEGRAEPRAPASIDAIVLLDSLHASFSPGASRLEPGQLPMFVETARAAEAGSPLFFLTHTAIQTEGYASTTETSAFLLRELNVEATPVTPDPEGSPRITEVFERGQLYVRGYAGGTKEAHCEQLRLLPPILVEHVLPAFASRPD